jgi:hypothetical protein
LRLSAETSAQLACAQTNAIGTTTIPLRKTAPGRRAEDFDTHSL